MDVIAGILDLIVKTGAALARLLFRILRWLLKRLIKSLRQPKTFGRARFATHRQLKRRGFFKQHGFRIGRIQTLLGSRELRFPDEGHVAIVAPPRAGKGIFVVIPNILDHPGSLVINDVKRELFETTSRYRATLGPVFRLDLTDPATSNQLNPLSLVRVGTVNAVDDATLLASLLITPDPKASAHWNQKAQEFLTAIILFTLYTQRAELHTLAEVYRLVHQHEVHADFMIEAMQRSEFEICRSVANDMETLVRTDEGRSVWSNLRKALALWSPDRVAAQVTADSDFDLASFKERTATLFLIIPPDKTALYSPFTRVFTGMALAAMTRDARAPTHPVMFMLDETRMLGKLDLLDEMVGLAAGYGTRIVTVWQDRQQCIDLYGDDRIITMSGLQIYLGVSNVADARLICERIGQYTVKSRSEGATASADAVLTSGASFGANEAGRPLIYPAEIMQSSDIFAFVQKFPAIRCLPAPYFKEPRWRGLTDTWSGRAPRPLRPPPLDDIAA